MKLFLSQCLCRRMVTMTENKIRYLVILYVSSFELVLRKGYNDCKVYNEKEISRTRRVKFKSRKT